VLFILCARFLGKNTTAKSIPDKRWKRSPAVPDGRSKMFLWNFFVFFFTRPPFVWFPSVNRGKPKYGRLIFCNQFFSHSISHETYWNKAYVLKLKMHLRLLAKPISQKLALFWTHSAVTIHNILCALEGTQGVHFHRGNALQCNWNKTYRRLQINFTYFISYYKRNTYNIESHHLKNIS